MGWGGLGVHPELTRTMADSKCGAPASHVPQIPWIKKKEKRKREGNDLIPAGGKLRRSLDCLLGGTAEGPTMGFKVAKPLQIKLIKVAL